MKKIFLFLLLLNLSSYLFAQSKDEAAIRKAINKQIEAWNNGDIDTFMQTYWKSDSLMFIGSSAPTYGWKTTLENYKNHYPDTATMGKLSFNLVRLKQLSPDYYFVVGGWHLTRNMGDVGGYFTLLFRKINGSWVIVVDHTS
jgi:ketosteroid isomerase-like protein